MISICIRMSSRDIIAINLQLNLIKNATKDGWRVRRLNDKQIELLCDWDGTINYEKICYNLLTKNYMLSA